MTGFKLSDPRNAADPLARFFRSGEPARLSVSEQVAFSNGEWLPLGNVTLHSPKQERDELLASVRQGSYAWRVPPMETVADDLRKLFGFEKYEKARREKAEKRLSGILNNMAAIAVRTGLVRPRFDPQSIAEMPFRRPTTIVADTSGVLQGAMSFIADHLHPMARLKIPAVLHMEVINQADRFLKTRRSTGVRGEVTLFEHLLSQTGQRTLLRLELREDTEVERNLLLSDPLRSAFKEDRDPELRDLNLTVPLKSYVDRMILETARQHQSYASPGHPVLLLTADQGLAKMALAEGIKPLFFKATTAEQLFDRTLSGSLLHPFNGKLVANPLAGLLWDLATAFGRVRIDREGDDGAIEVVAIDQDLGWSSYHSQDDLLWLKETDVPVWTKPTKNQSSAEDDFSLDVSVDTQPVDKLADKAPTPRKAASLTTGRLNATGKIDAGKSRLSPTNFAGEAFYRLSVADLVTLIDRLGADPRLSQEQVAETLGVKHPSGIGEYRRFLQSGGFIEVDGGDWAATDALLSLATAQREGDRARVSELLKSAPSYNRFVDVLVDAAASHKPVELPMPSRVQPTYLALGEVTGVAASIPGEGYYATMNRPDLHQFAALALARYNELGPVDGWVAVGEWLEALIRSDGVHPVMARDLLQEADGAKLLKRSTEGSTTDTRHDDHAVRVLRIKEGAPVVETIHLYRGDFLIPGKSSSSLRIEERQS